MTISIRSGIVLLALTQLMSTPSARAAKQEYNFKDPKGVNSILFVLDSVVEPIMGLAGGVSGTVTFDPLKPKMTSGKIVVATKSLYIAHRGMKNTVQSAEWLDAKRHPTIEFTLKKVNESKILRKGVYELDVTGDISCKGVTKELTTKVTITYLPGKLSERQGGQNGDLLILRSNFVIKRSDHNIKSGMGSMVVADEIELRVSIVGTCKKG